MVDISMIPLYGNYRCCGCGYGSTIIQCHVKMQFKIDDACAMIFTLCPRCAHEYGKQLLKSSEIAISNREGVRDE